MPVFGLHSTSDDWLGWSMDSNPICHPSPANKIKCSFLDYVQLLVISRAGRWTQTHPPPLSSQQNKILLFGLHSTSDDRPGWSMGLEPHLPPLSSQQNKMLIFGLRSTSDDWPGWSMDLNPVRHPSPAKKIKCLFLDYIQLLMIGRAGRWTRTPSATPLCSFLDYVQLLMIS